jgi:hypothetical protein
MSAAWPSVVVIRAGADLREEPTMASDVPARVPSQALPVGRGCGPGGQSFPSAGQSGRCAVPGCGQVIDGSRLMCRDDWYAVPKPIRDRVWATWRSRNGVATAEHQEAVRSAVLASQALRPKRSA